MTPTQNDITPRATQSPGYLFQVSRLVIIHEEGEAGSEMPDLSRPVLAVSKAVHNLVKVGREMVQTTDDKVMQQVGQLFSLTFGTVMPNL